MSVRKKPVVAPPRPRRRDLDRPIDLANFAAGMREYKARLWASWVMSGGSKETRDPRLYRLWQHVASAEALASQLVIESINANQDRQMALLLAGVPVCPKCSCIHEPNSDECRALRNK